MKIKNLVLLYKKNEWIYAYESALHIIVRFCNGKAETIVRLPKELHSVIFSQFYIKDNYIFLYSIKDAKLYIYNMDERREKIKTLDDSNKGLDLLYSELLVNDNNILFIPHKDAKPLVYDFNGNELSFHWLKAFGKAISKIYKENEAKMIRVMGNVFEKNTIGCICIGGLYDKIMFFDMESCSYKFIKLEGYENLYQLCYKNGMFFVQGDKDNSLYLVGFDMDGNILAEYFLSNNTSLHLQWWNNDSLVIFEDNVVYKIKEPWKKDEKINKDEASHKIVKKVSKIEFNNVFYYWGPGFLVDDEGNLYESDGERLAHDYEAYLSKDKDFCKYKYEKTDEYNGFFVERDIHDLEAFISSIL